MTGPGAGTRVVAVLGDPVAHSRSPAMHNAAFAALGLDYVYVACRVPPERVGDAVAGLRALDFAGANVTIPHKQAVMPHLDTVSDTAQRIGAVNTIVNRDGALHGDNTDAPGFRRSIKADLGMDLTGSRCLVLGAGGSARAVLVALVDAGARSITVANRTVARAEQLVGAFAGELGDCSLAEAPLDGDGAFRDAVGEADLIVNCTSVGMDDDAAPFDLGLLSGSAVYDLIYTRETALVRVARAAGAPAANGLGMLLYQGAAAFEQWTGRDAPIDVMRGALEAALADDS